MSLGEGEDGWSAIVWCYGGLCGLRAPSQHGTEIKIGNVTSMCPSRDTIAKCVPSGKSLRASCSVSLSLAAGHALAWCHHQDGPQPRDLLLPLLRAGN